MPPGRILKIALIQLQPKSLDPQYNFSEASKHIEDAAADGACLAVLPEYHLTGWVPEDPRFYTIARQAEGYLTEYQRLAEKLKINIVPGTIVTAGSQHDSSTGNSGKQVLYNVASFIDDTGRIVGQYTKANLWHPERDHLTSGPASRSDIENDEGHHQVFDTPLGPVGLLVCYDLFWPEGFRALVRQGAKIIIIPTFTKADDMSAEGLAFNPDGEALFIKSATVTRAYENTCCIIFCNVGGPREHGFVGLSQVAMPIAGMVGGFSGPEEGMKVVEVDMRILDIAEANYKIRQDLCSKGFHYSV